nr:hypothetical protein BaRGS_030799 [Batillaria attramentaria]
MASFSEEVQDLSQKIGCLRLDAQQLDVVQSSDQYVFITGPPASAAPHLEEKDVLIVVTATSLYMHMNSLIRSALYEGLTSSKQRNFRVKVLQISDDFDPHSPEILMMHVRAPVHNLMIRALAV